MFCVDVYSKSSQILFHSFSALCGSIYVEVRRGLVSLLGFDRRAGTNGNSSEIKGKLYECRRYEPLHKRKRIIEVDVERKTSHWR